MQKHDQKESGHFKHPTAMEDHIFYMINVRCACLTKQRNYSARFQIMSKLILL
jgi:hypothetical protein